MCVISLASALIASGVRSKDTVAIYADRNSSLVLVILGILKAGASFLILDPAYPPARTLDYLRIAQAKGWLQLDGNGPPPDELSNYLDHACRCYLAECNVPRQKARCCKVCRHR